ncbi:MAG: MFS transporter [Bacteroidota bacterium]
MNYNIVKTILLFASTLTVMSGAIVAPALPSMASYFSEQSVSDLLVRLIITMPALMIAFFSPSFGKLIDQYGRKTPLIAGLILYAIAGTSGFYLDNIYYLLFSRIVLGIAVAAVMNSVTTLIGDYFEGEERSAFMGYQAAFMAMGGMVFVSFGGAVADLDWRLTFLMYGFSILLILPAAVYLKDINKEKKESKAYNNQNPEIEVDKLSVYAIYIMGFLGMAFFYFIPVQIPFYLKSINIEGSVYGGIAIGVTTFFAGLASLSFSRLKRKLSFQAIIGISYLVMAMGCIIISSSASFTILLVGLCTYGLGAGLIMPGANLWLMSIVPAQSRGKFVGGLTAAFFTGQFVSPIIASPIINASSIGGLFLDSSILMVAISLFWFSGLYKKIIPS